MAVSQSQTIRPLAIADAAAFRQLRLKTLAASPECFCTSQAEAEQQSKDQYRRQISICQKSPGQFLFGYFADIETRHLHTDTAAGQRLIGVIGVERLSGMLRRHRAHIHGLLVDGDYRRQGVARTLCQHAIEQARRMEVEKLSLELTGEAVAALHLYRSLGFRIESVEPLALKLEGRYLDEIRMSLCF